MASEGSALPIVLVHGLWLTPRSWEGWKERLEKRVRRGRPHFAGALGWEAVADYALDRADDHTGATVPRMTWHPRQLAEQTGRTFFVTGANSGIGLEAARALVGRGAHVVLVVRDTAKGEQAAARLEVSLLDQRLEHDPRGARTLLAGVREQLDSHSVSWTAADQAVIRSTRLALHFVSFAAARMQRSERAVAPDLGAQSAALDGV
jgi:hypothetical protein